MVGSSPPKNFQLIGRNVHCSRPLGGVQAELGEDPEEGGSVHSWEEVRVVVKDLVNSEEGTGKNTFIY